MPKELDLSGFDEEVGTGGAGKPAPKVRPPESSGMDLSGFDDEVSKHEMKQSSPEASEDEPKLSEALLRKTGQGLTFGLMDEGVAAAQAGLDVATSDKKLSDLHQLYQTYKQLQNDREKEVSEKYPKVSMGAEIAGSLPTAFTGLGTANTLGKAAALGGLYGLGKSEADLTSGDTDQLIQGAKDTAVGAVTGGVGYKVAPLIGKAIQKTGLPGIFSKAGQGLQSEAESDALKVFSPGVKDIKKELGNSLFSPEDYTKGIGKEAFENMQMTGGPTEVRLKVAQKIKDLSGQKQELLSNINEQLQQKLETDPSIQTLSGAGENSLENTLNGYKNELIAKTKRTDPMGSLVSKKRLPGADPEDETAMVETIGNLDNYIKEVSQHDNNLLELDRLRGEIGEKLGNSSFVRDPNSPEGLNEQILKKVYYTVQKRIEDLSSVVNPKLGDMVKSFNMKQSNLLDLGRIAFNNEAKAGVASHSMSGNFTAMTAGGGLAAAAGVTGGLPLLAAGLTAVGAKKGVEKLTGFETSQLGRMGLSKLESGAGGLATATGNALQNQNVIQAGVRSTAETMKPLEMSQKAYSASSEELSGAAQKLMTNPQFQHYGKSLQDALASKDPEKKNAVIFTILQNPNMRKFINEQ